MKTIAIVLGFSLTSNSFGWCPIFATRSTYKSMHNQVLNLSSKSDPSDFSSDVTSKEMNPCWQDFYDDDCSMSTIYGASFIAQDWIKSMPCASGLDVSTNMKSVRH